MTSFEICWGIYIFSYKYTNISQT